MRDHLVQLIEQLFLRLPYELSSVSVVTDPDTGMIRADIEIAGDHDLIGHEGETLWALEHVIKKQLEKNLPGSTFDFHIDIGGYRSNQIEQLKATAKILAERARMFEQDIACHPMSSYERFIVHATLAEFPDIATESAGEGPDRHIVIKYKPQEK